MEINYWLELGYGRGWSSSSDLTALFAPFLFYSYHTSRHYPQVTPLIRILASSYVIMAVVANSGGTSPVNPTVEKYENPKKGKRKEHKTFPLINLLDNGSPKTQIRRFFFFLLLYYHLGLPSCLYRVAQNLCITCGRSASQIRWFCFRLDSLLIFTLYEEIRK